MIVVANKPGQLGNMLFVYSNLIARAIESNLKVANTALDDYADLFPATSRDLMCRFPPVESRIRCTPLRRRLIYHIFHFITRVLSKLRLELPFIRQITFREWYSAFDLADPAFLASLKPRQWVLLRGWFSDPKARGKHAGAIREFFKPREHNQRNIDDLISRARVDADILIGVHIRQGIIHFGNARMYFYSTPRYAEMMDDLLLLFSGKRVSFLICSDWPQDRKVFSRFRVTFGTNDLIEDLYALARCDYLIGPPSTFTTWASFYGQVPLNVIYRNEQRQAIEDFRLETQ